MRAYYTVAIVLMLVLAGCGGSTGPDSTQTETQTAIEETEVQPTGTATATAAPTATPVPPQNPWRKDVVTVKIVDRTGSDRNWEPLVQETLQFWSENASQYTNFEVNFEMAAEGEGADITVFFRPELRECGYTISETTVGCADQYNSVGSADKWATVGIEAGYTNESTEETLKHEFGHMLGLTHDDSAELEFMRAKAEVVSRPLPNATEREYPWNHEPLTVYVDYENISDSRTQEQVNTTLRELPKQADAIPDQVEFVKTSNSSEADIRVTFPAGEDDDISIGTKFGYDPDNDDALEYYSHAEIRIGDDIDTENVGWHLAVWLADAVGVNYKQLPNPLDNTDASRDDWWK